MLRLPAYATLHNRENIRAIEEALIRVRVLSIENAWKWIQVLINECVSKLMDWDTYIGN